MDDSTRRIVRAAAEAVEQAQQRVLGMIGEAGSEARLQGWSESRQGMEYLTGEEVGALRSASVDLRSACNRLWSLCEAGAPGR